MSERMFELAPQEIGKNKKRKRILEDLGKGNDKNVKNACKITIRFVH
jgi:hypothetical protein